MIYKKILLVCFACLVSLLTNAQTPDLELPKRLAQWHADIENKQIPHIVSKQLNTQRVEGDIPVTITYKDTLTNKLVAIEYSSMGDWTEKYEKFYFKDGELYYKYTKKYYGETYYTPEELGITEEQAWQGGPNAKTLEYTIKHVYYTKDSVITYTKVAVLPADYTIDKEKELENFPYTRTEIKDINQVTVKADLEDVLEIIDLYEKGE